MRCAAAYCFIAVLGILQSETLAANIPKVPAKDGVGFFIHDVAGLIDPATRERIGGYQQTAFEKHQTPIIVVTINKMSTYEHSGSIESLATEWFNTWRIGTTDLEGGTNRGILLLVSRGDRKARIELGGDWGHRWDNHCITIMQTQIIPQFKQNDYGSGIASGVSALSKMAASGPDGIPPAVSLPKRVGRAAEKSSEGLGGCGAALLTPFLVLFGIIASLFGGGSGGSSSYDFSSSYSSSSGGYSGGGYSGGSSGGGGATGSW